MTMTKTQNGLENNSQMDYLSFIERLYFTNTLEAWYERNYLILLFPALKILLLFAAALDAEGNLVNYLLYTYIVG